MKKEKNDIDSLLQEWQKYIQRVKLAPNLSEEELMQIFTESEKMPSVPTPPLPPDPHPAPRLRYATATILIVVGGLLLLFLLNRGASHADAPLQAQHTAPANTDVTLPAAEPPSIPAAAPAQPHPVTPIAPRHTTVAETRTPLPATADTPQPQPAAPADTPCQPCNTTSLDNVQYNMLVCNSAPCDTQRYINQILIDLA